MRRTVAVAVALAAMASLAGDWPMRGYEVGRTSVSPDPLPPALTLQWVRRLPAPSPAWPASQDRLQFDRTYEPVVVGRTIFVPSMVSDSVTAFDSSTGDEVWRFHADGPVRFAPAAWRDRLFVVSDDGFLYALEARSGRMLWKVRGGPDDRKVLGNDRLISAWPARGGPVVYDSTVYFAAGIWPFMGVFVRAVDAETGVTIWCNSGAGASFTVQPHNSPAFAGIAPQGYLAATSERLLVPSGRAVPAVLDRQTGRLLYFLLAAGKKNGGCDVVAAGDVFVNDGLLCHIGDGRTLRKGPLSAITADTAYSLSGSTLSAVALPPEEAETPGKDGKPVKKVVFRSRFEAQLNPAPDRLFLKAGDTWYGAAAGGAIVAVSERDGTATVSWQGRIAGTPAAMIAADGRLFVVAAEGDLYCFGAGAAGAPRVHARPKVAPPPDSSTPRVRAMLAASGAGDGYALLLGGEYERMAEELVAQSALHLIVVEPDARKAAAFRRRMDDAGAYGRRVAVLSGDPAALRLPPYFASLIVADAMAFERAPTVQVLESLRPYGGTALMLGAASKACLDAVRQWARTAGLADGDLAAAGDELRITRSGPIPGSAAWTHQYADAANTVVSCDQLVKAPLGLLWFGGPPNDPILPRHGHGPSPQVVGGRLFIEGADLLRAVDVYTGRLLWERPLPGLGAFYDKTEHQPGANEIGANYASATDGVYVAWGQRGLRLDPATGGTLQEFRLPSDDGGHVPYWGYIGVWGDYLIAGAAPFMVTEKKPAAKAKKAKGDEDDEEGGAAATREPTGEVEVRTNSAYADSSKRLVVMDRRTGRVLWQRDAAYAFRHNTIAAGGGRVFCLDSVTPAKLALLARRGLATDAPASLYALDIRSGDVVWSLRTEEPGAAAASSNAVRDVFGTWLGYSESHDVLLQAGSRGRDRARDEVDRGMIAFRGRDGAVLWQTPDRTYGGPCLLRRDAIITQDGASYDLLTGRQLMRPSPLSGAQVAWSFSRNYGCNTALGGEHLLTFRSAAAGYCNLERDGGTGNLGGFKSGCTGNLIPADGVLNAPDYTRTCTCSYQNQSSLAFVHDPTAEEWTFTPTNLWNGERIARVGINFGAPGDRVAPDGTLWLEAPAAGSPSPGIPVSMAGTDPTPFRHHASLLQGDGWPWVNASGVAYVTNITVGLARDASPERAYTVRLYFSEPEDKTVGARVFDVALQGTPVLRDFDIRREAGAAFRGIVREFRGIRVGDTLRIGFSPSRGRALICGVEAIADDP